MILNDILFLAGYTGRSQAYAQALAQADLHPEHVLLFGQESGKLPGQIESLKSPGMSLDIFLPDLSESLKMTCKRCGWHAETVDADHVNDLDIQKYVSSLRPKLIIYSGYGAQLVGEDILSLGAPLLHLHAGWLPDYRGSTTLYYSWLKENVCGVTAILLNQQIDMGGVVAKKKYPPPPLGLDPDYIYDASIRADLLVEVMQLYTRENGFPNVEAQSEEGTTYYVIHPVLKHLARLRGEPI